MRRFLVMLQLLLLGLPTFASVAALRRESGMTLPACCRRAGMHHCAAMQTASAGEASGDAVAFRAVPQQCPYCPRALPSAQHAPASIAPAAFFFAQIVSHPACAAQTLAKRRIARDRSRQKRGPPAIA